MSKAYQPIIQEIFENKYSNQITIFENILNNIADKWQPQSLLLLNIAMILNPTDNYCQKFLKILKESSD